MGDQGIGGRLRARSTCLGRILVASFGLAATIEHAGAQPVPPAQLPSPAQPGISPLERVLPRPEAPEPGEPVTIRALPEMAIPEGAAATPVEIVALSVDGATVYSADEISAFTRDVVGQTVPLSRVFEVARAIETRYRSDGYILSRAFVPPQTVADGRFRIQVVEGYVSDIVVQGELGAARSLVESYLANIAGGGPANIRKIERYLLLVNDIPGVTARGSLRPAAEVPGASQLVVEGTVKNFGAFATSNNRNSRFAGPWSAAVGANVNAMTAFGDRTDMIIYRTIPKNKQKLFQVSQEARVGSEGTKVRGFVSYGPYTPGFTLRQLDVESWTKAAGLHVSHPVIRSRRMNLLFDLGFDYQDAKTDMLDTRFNDDRTRMVRLTSNFDFRDSWGGVTTLQVAGHQGVDIMGASAQNSAFASRQAGVPTAFKATGEISRLQSLYSDPKWAINLYGAAIGQWAARPLLSPEEFQVGGERYGRGFWPAELTGDHGAGATAELQVNGETGFDIFSRYQIYAFYDYGTVWNRDATAGPREFLSSAGLGVRFEVLSWLNGELEYARPLSIRSNADPFRGRSPMVYTRMTAKF